MLNHSANIEELRAQVVELSSRLNVAEALKSHFISNVANEIVNPFSSILGLSSQMMEIKSIDITQVKHLASLIHTEAFHLDFQLRNIFAAAKIEAGQTEPEIRTFKISEAVADLVGLFKLEANKRNLDIQTVYVSGASADTTWTTDIVKLKLIIINFLHNSVKFSKNNSEIEIRIGQEGDTLSIGIKDNGIGIPADQVGYIFDRFKTIGTGINTAYRGNGLGLAVNKSLADIIGANIHLKTKEGEGTEFTINIPRLNITAEQTANSSEFLFDDELIF